MCVCGHRKENQKICLKKDLKNRGSNYFSQALVSHINISQFLCWRFVNSSTAHLTSVNILDLIEFSGANTKIQIL